MDGNGLKGGMLAYTNIQGVEGFVLKFELHAGNVQSHRFILFHAFQAVDNEGRISPFLRYRCVTNV